MKTDLERLLDKTIPEPNSGCWLWLGGINSKGYGSFMLGGKMTTAHRASWTLHCGVPHPGLMLCHKCDVRECVNPDHLYLGTNTTNMQDMVARGRMKSTVGSANPRARLSEDQVRLVLAADNRTNRCLARDLGVSIATIAMIRSGRNWSHIKRAAE